jgi:formylglycine-generating enzyme required for sulfatase activity
MIFIPGGEFIMGTDDPQSYLPERPAHRIIVDSFWIDEHPVTNQQFAKFIKATKYITTAEKKPDWEELKKQLPPGTPKPSDNKLVPASLVFKAPKDAVPLNNMHYWWHWVPGAHWKHPEGAKSHLKHKNKHPVVQVSWEDAKAYCEWRGASLATEAQWEYAARGGLKEKRYAWGDELKPQGQWMANIFQGKFPHHNTQEDGFAGTSPVKSFPPNAYGLYDMIGNVWEWCADFYSTKIYHDYKNHGTIKNPQGPDKPFDPEFPLEPRRVIKGGSFLCSDHYCLNYRPSARRGMAQDTSMSHIGFRCVSNRS